MFFLSLFTSMGCIVIHDLREGSLDISGGSQILCDKMGVWFSGLAKKPLNSNINTISSL